MVARGIVSASASATLERVTKAFRAGPSTVSQRRDVRGLNSIAAGRDSSATAADALAFGANASATATSGIAIGGGYAGAAAVASGAGAVAIAVGDTFPSTASGAGTFVCGQGSSASGAGKSYVFGNGASGTNGGWVFSSESSGASAASASGSFAYGVDPSASRTGQHAYANGKFATAGDAQRSDFVSRVSTTNATPTELSLNGSTSYLTIPAGRTMAFTIKLAAARTDVSDTAAAWPSITGAITRDSTGNCRLLGAVMGAGTTTLADAGAATWSVSVTADATNNRLAITVTGEAGKTIRWLATIEAADLGG